MKSDKIAKIISIIILVPVILFTVYFAGVKLFFFAFSDKTTGTIVASNFMLASESRLPNWFNDVAKYDKSDLTAKIFYYSSAPEKPDVKVVLMSKTSKKTLETQYGRTGHHSGEFVLININGVNEVIKNKGADPGDINALFYVSDDPNIMKILKY